jgi:hypothetical protein
MVAQKPLKIMNPKSPELKYTGNEPEWRVQPTEENRVSRLSAAFAWYNYHYGKKDVKEIIIDWLTRNDRVKEAKDFAKVPDNTITNVYGWVARMNLRGLELTESETLRLNNVISGHIVAAKSVQQVVEIEVKEPEIPRITIQDRLREKATEAAGEIDGMFDDLIVAGSKMGADFKPITILRGMNVAPQMVSPIVDHWKLRLAELEEVAKGTDSQLVEGYSNFGKLQIRNLIKFCEQVIADCGSYVQLKKVERKPRKKKAVSPERVVARFKYMREFPELKLTSELPTKLIDAQEAWLYDTKKRKLIYVVADTHVGSFTVKGTGLIGFDTNLSVQKTLRKPADQIKALLTGGVAQQRKYFKDIKSTEIKFNGRSSDNLILLKVR